MSDPQPMSALYENIATAPIVYFDLVAAHGMVGGAIEIELACRHLIPNRSGGVDVKLATSARIRCSPAAAMTLKTAIDNSLVMLQQNAAQPLASPGKLN
jgi:hypothetical protein